MAQPSVFLRQKGFSAEEVSIRARQQVSFYFTLRNLALSLRELHCLTRLACDHFPEVGSMRDTDLDAITEANDMVPLFMDMAFVYLRRLGDRIAGEIRPILFLHWNSVPTKLANWDSDKLQRNVPLCDFDILCETLQQRMEWFAALREFREGFKGLRDTLEHRRIRFITGTQRVNFERPTYTVNITSLERDVDVNTELVSRLRKCVSGLCSFMTGLHRSVTGEGEYCRGDEIRLLTGNDDDAVGYWPEIVGSDA
jgi:hypothetical protein